MPFYALENRKPVVAPSAWIAPDASVIGGVHIGEYASIWFSAVIRGDNEDIIIGDATNIQDNCTLHTDIGYTLTIEKNCTIGHNVILHGCTIQQGTLIGMGSTIMNGARVGTNCLIGANTLITENKIIPDNSLVIGSPAKILRKLTHQEIESVSSAYLTYCRNALQFRTGLTNYTRV